MVPCGKAHSLGGLEYDVSGTDECDAIRQQLAGRKEA